MLTASSASPHAQVMDLLTRKMAAQALTQVAELGVADLLKDGPRTADQLAAAARVQGDALYRVMRALAAVGFFTEHPERVFANNASSEVLRTDVPGSMRAMTRWLGEETSWWKAWGHLGHSLRSGGSAAEVALGGTAFEFFGRDPRVNEIFQAAMTDFSVVTARAVAEAYDFSGINRIVDVGGGHGSLLSAVLSAFPEATGVLYDLPEVIEGADANLKSCGQFKRIDKVAGSFFDGVPDNADAYIMKHIIHDWDDARCLRLLENCRQGLNPGGRLLIVEQVISDRPESLLGKLFDLEMLVMTPGGRERTEGEFQKLLRSAGFEMQRIVPTQSPVCVIEAVVAKPVRVTEALARHPGAVAVPVA